jgi:hypothetical protein
VLRFRSLRAVSAVALTGAIALVAVPFAGPATASGLKIKCTQVAGIEPTGFSLSGCTGNTGGGSTHLAGAIFSSPLTITWLNGTATTVMWTASSNEADPSETLTCAAGTTEQELKGTVTADSTGSAPVGGVAKGEACVRPSLPTVYNNEPGSAFKFK